MGGQYTLDDLKNKHIVFYDGSCGLCHGSVQWLLKVDKNKQLYYATQQGDHFTALTKMPQQLDAIIYYRKGSVHDAAEALAMICLDLGGGWRFFYGLWKVLPGRFSRFLYYLIAKRRYGIFGEATSCKLPSIEERARMLS